MKAAVSPSSDKWRKYRLDDVVSIAQGQVDPREEPFASMLHVGPEDIESGTGRLLSAHRARDLQLISGKYLFKSGEIVYSKIRPYLRKAWLADFDGICSADMYPLRTREGFSASFVASYLLSDDFTTQVVATQDRTGIPKVNREQLSAVELDAPQIAEQESRASAITAVQKAIATEEARIKTLHELRSAVAEQVFRYGIRPHESALGELPGGWRASRLGDVITRAQYGLSVRGERVGDLPILRMNCQLDGRVVFRDLQYVTLDPATASAYELIDGDLLFNRTNSIDLVGRTALFEGSQRAVFASYLIRLSVDTDAVVPSFLNAYFNLVSVQQSLKALATRGVSQSNISASKLKEFVVPIPTIAEQREIISIIDSLNARIGHATERAKTLRTLLASALNTVLGRTSTTTTESAYA